MPRARSSWPKRSSTRIPAASAAPVRLRLTPRKWTRCSTGGARWAVERGYGTREDLERIEEHGAMAAREAGGVSDAAKKRQRDEIGTLGSGNHYLEVQHVAEIFDRAAAEAFGLATGDIVDQHPLRLARPRPPDRHRVPEGDGNHGDGYGHRLAGSRARLCADPTRPWARRYLGAMRAAINCALANRQILTHLARKVVRAVLPRREARAALRCFAQHVQGRGSRRRRQAAATLRPPQRCDARFRSGSSGLARGIA